MKLLIFALLLSTTTQAAHAFKPFDVFFQGDKNHFVMVTKNKTTVTYSACVVYNAEGAYCSDIVEVNNDQFWAMRWCEGAKTGVNAVEAAGGAVVTAGATIAGALPLAGGSAVVTIHGYRNFNIAQAKYNIYNKANQNDRDQSSSEYYNRYIELIKETMESSFWDCDIAGNFKEVSSAPRYVQLTATQKEWLSKQ